MRGTAQTIRSRASYEISLVPLQHTGALCPAPRPDPLNDNRSSKHYLTLFIQQVQDAQLCFYEVYARLVIIKVNQGPRDLLLHVFFLLQLEHVLRPEAQGQGEGTADRLGTYPPKLL